MKDVVLILVVMVLVACSTTTDEPTKTTSPRIRKNSSIALPKTNQKVNFSEGIQWELQVADGQPAIDSFQIEGLGESVTIRGASGSWTPTSPRAGTPKLKLTVHMGANNEVHYPRLKFVPSQAPKKFTYKVINTFPHNPEAYIQGFLVMDDRFIESTGQYGRSTLMKTKLNGDVINRISLEDQFFGEGCTVWDDKIYQLTWHEQTVLVYDMDFNELDRLPFSNQRNEGWGLTTWRESMIMTDGSENLYFMDPNRFTETDRIQVYRQDQPVGNLNELETVGELIYANVYGKEIVVMIDPLTGAVVGEIDFSGLLARGSDGTGIDYVLNGIAYDSENDRLFVTGKLWKTIFEVELVEKPDVQ